LVTDPDGPDFTATTYDSLGRVAREYNSTRCTPPTTNCGESTWGYTAYAYDALGRTTSVTKQDGNIVTTAYSGNTTTVTDEVGKKRQSTTDALGRLTQVVEDPGGLGYVTNYTYDALDNLLSIVQNGSRQRTFNYNSLSQLTSATNPNPAPSRTLTTPTATSHPKPTRHPINSAPPPSPRLTPTTP